MKLVPTLFVVPGKMTADRRMKRISVSGTPSRFRDLPEPKNPLESIRHKEENWDGLEKADTFSKHANS